MKLKFLWCLLFAAVASAGTLTVTGVDWSRGSSVWIREDGQDVDAWFAGVMTIRLTQDGVSYDRDAMCVDLFTRIYLNSPYDNQVVDPAAVSGRNLGRVAWLVDNAMWLGGAGSLLPESDWVRDAEQGAGLQLAIWDIVHDNGDGFGAGRVQAVTNWWNRTDPEILSWAQHYGGVSEGQSSDLLYVYRNYQPGTLTQAQMLAGPRFVAEAPEPAPEPGSLAMFGAGFVLIGIRVWSRRRKAPQVNPQA